MVFTLFITYNNHPFKTQHFPDFYFLTLPRFNINIAVVGKPHYRGGKKNAKTRNVRGGFNNKCEWSNISTNKKYSKKI
jgi:hypothetical protein